MVRVFKTVVDANEINMYDAADYNLQFMTGYLGYFLIVGYVEGYLIQAIGITAKDEDDQNVCMVKSDEKNVLVKVEVFDKRKQKKVKYYGPNRDVMIRQGNACIASNRQRVVYKISEGYQRKPRFKKTAAQSIADEHADERYPIIFATGSRGSYNTDSQLGMIKWSPFKDCEQRQFFHYSGMLSGFGYCLPCFSGDNAGHRPIYPYFGEPFLISLDGDIKTFAEWLFNCLHPLYKVCLAVNFIKEKNDHIVIINKHQKASKGKRKE